MISKTAAVKPSNNDFFSNPQGIILASIYSHRKMWLILKPNTGLFLFVNEKICTRVVRQEQNLNKVTFLSHFVPIRWPLLFPGFPYYFKVKQAVKHDDRDINQAENTKTCQITQMIMSKHKWLDETNVDVGQKTNCCKNFFVIQYCFFKEFIL